MGKIIYTCGHIEEIEGNDVVIKRRNICPECKAKKIKIGKESAKELNLPDLLGSPSQIENAEGLRLNWIVFAEMLDENYFDLTDQERLQIKTTVNNILKNIISASWYLDKLAYKENGMINYCKEHPMLEKVSWKIMQPSNYENKFAIVHFQSDKDLRKITFYGSKDDKMVKFLRKEKYTWLYKNKSWEFVDEDSDSMEFERMFKRIIEELFSLGFKVYYEKSRENIF